nr:unnamed protein product [Callosobruchus analis]
MDAVEVVQFCYLVQQFVKNKKRKNRRWWVHPINRERYLHGHSVTLLPRLRSDPEKFFNYFRMCPRSFDELLNFIKDQITHEDTNMRKAISAEEMLAFTLWYLASGCSLKDIHYNYRMGRSTVAKLYELFV